MSEYEEYEILDISNTKVKDIGDVNIHKNIKYLICKNCDLESIDKLPKHITRIDCHFNTIKYINNLYNHNLLETIICDFNQIEKFEPRSLPKNLRYLSCVANLLHTLQGLPSKIRHLYVDDNYLKSFKGIPLNVYLCSCRCNYITSLEYLNDRINTLYISFNPIYDINAYRPKSLLIIDNIVNNLI